MKIIELYESYALRELQQKIITTALRIGAIKIRPDNPFTWASGYRMPVYNDNRMLLAYPGTRPMVIAGLHRLLKYEGIQPEYIAGTATAGIPWGAVLAHELELPFAYIRDKPKDHGLMNRIEGLDSDKDFNNAKVIVVEDLISTGGSSANVVQAAQEAKGNLTHAREHIELVKLLIRLCKDLGGIPFVDYVNIQPLIENVSKQLTGWQKSS
jgi:orotate phosphoribosyltransferase